MKQFAILGAQPSISREELRTVLQTPIHASDQIALFSTKLHLDDLQSQLGGVSKMGTVIGSVTRESLEKTILQELEQVPENGKLHFGISVYSLGGPVKDIRKDMFKVGLSIKKQVKSTGRSVRFVDSKEATLSSVVVKKNNLHVHGTEFVLFVKQDEVLLGRTQTVQPFEEWSYRDYQRPATDAKRGMLPPKLARIMLNITGISIEEKTVLDPFCGSGTVLMEAAFLKAKHLIGSDKQEQATVDTANNLKWLQEDDGILAFSNAFKTAFPKTTILHASAQTVSEHIPEETVDALVTEPFLGTPRQGSESTEDVEREIEHLTNLYTECFSALRPTLSDDARIVISSPVHIVHSQRFAVQTKRILEEMGYTHIPFSEPLIYEREGQYVARELLRFIK